MQMVQAQLPGSKAVLVGYIHGPAGETGENGQRPCMVVCPGGGYQCLAPHEAEPVALAFYAKGFQSFVVYYTIAEDDDSVPLGLAPLSDLSMALALIRKNHEIWGIRRDSVAVLGFSAGGHLAASLGTLWNHPLVQSQTGLTQAENKPNALVLCYPVITPEMPSMHGSIDRLTGKGADQSLFALDRQVSAHTPPCFLWHTFDDETVPVENALRFMAALARTGIRFEAHIFEHGAHGLSLCSSEAGGVNRCGAWVNLCMQWLGTLFDFPVDTPGVFG